MSENSEPYYDADDKLVRDIEDKDIDDLEM